MTQEEALSMYLPQELREQARQETGSIKMFSE
jgi:hypothetical protein